MLAVGALTVAGAAATPAVMAALDHQRDEAQPPMAVAATSALSSPDATTAAAEAERLISAQGRPVIDGSAARTAGDGGWELWRYETGERAEQMLVRPDGQSAGIFGCGKRAEVVWVCGSLAGGGGPIVVTGGMSDDVASVRVKLAGVPASAATVGAGGWLAVVPQRQGAGAAVPAGFEALGADGAVIGTAPATSVRALVDALARGE